MLNMSIELPLGKKERNIATTNIVRKIYIRFWAICQHVKQINKLGWFCVCCNVLYSCIWDQKLISFDDVLQIKKKTRTLKDVRILMDDEKHWTYSENPFVGKIHVLQPNYIIGWNILGNVVVSLSVHLFTLFLSICL